MTYTMTLHSAQMIFLRFADDADDWPSTSCFSRTASFSSLTPPIDSSNCHWRTRLAFLSRPLVWRAINDAVISPKDRRNCFFAVIVTWVRVFCD